MTAPLAALKAHRWHVVVPALAVLATVSVVASGGVVPVPLAVENVPIPLLAGLAVVVVALVPLYPAVPQIDPMLVREPAVHRARVAGVAVLAVGAAMPGALAVPESGGTDATLLVVLVAVGLVATCVVGEFAWLVVLAAGLVAIQLGAGPGWPVGRLMSGLGLGWAVVLAGVAAVLVAVAGVRRVRL